MLSLLIYHLFITATCFNAGYVFYSFLHKKNAGTLATKNVVVILFTGLVVLTLICQVLILYFPLPFFTSIVLFLLFQSLALTKRNEYYGYLKKLAIRTKQLHLIVKGGFLTTWALLLLLNAGPTLMDDTESYHIQMVKWIQEYGTVPGIANLHERFGFNSSWFTSVALFSLPTQHNYYTVLNGLISVWLSLYLWVQADTVLKPATPINYKQTGFISLILLCLLLSLWPLLRGNVSTVNYDFITSAMILILFLESFSKAHDAVFDKFQVEYFLWPVYLFTVRIMNFPLLLLTVFALTMLFKKDKIKLAVACLLTAAVLVMPFFIRNVLLSGYAFFPSPLFDLFNVDWKADHKVIDDLLYYIKYYNRVNNMYQPLEKTAALHFPHWIGSWYQHLFFYDKPILLTGFGGFAAYILLPERNPIKNKTTLILVLAMLLQLVLWFVVAPDPRFVYGPLLCGTALLLYAVIFKLNSLLFKKLSFGIMGVLILFTTVLFFSKLWRDEGYRNPFICKKLPQPAVQKIKINTIDVYIPEKVLGNWNARCYATPLPCLYKVDSRLHLRGRTIKEGFSIQ